MVWIALLAACTETLVLPTLELDATGFHFAPVELGEVEASFVTLSNPGGLPLSVRSMTLTGDPAFSVKWSAADLECPIGSTGKTWDLVSGSAEAGTSIYDGALELGPGCKFPVTVEFSPTGPGVVSGAILIEAESGAWPADGRFESTPEIEGDPTDFRQELDLYGSGPTAETPLLWMVTRVVEAPWHWPDGTSTESTYEAVNVGNVPVSVLTPTLDQCGPDVEVIEAPNPGLEVQPLESVSVTVRHTPADPAALRCRITLPTDEGVSAVGELWFTPPSYSAPPEIQILSPLPGALLPLGEPVEVTIGLSDDLDTPTTMAVAIYSLVRGDYVLYARPGNDSGTVSMTVSGNALVAGADTLTVAAQDWHGNVGFNSVSVRVNAAAADDADGDGWGVVDGDCDDARPDIFPDAKEVTDAADQDCDGRIDDGTPESDDDGDGFAEDDCDDRDGDVFPGAIETADDVDNDCSGTVDEGTTLSDDDRDGYPEALGDCDDADPWRAPEYPDFCDDVDSDCDGDPEELCTFRDPVIVAIRVVPDACHAGDTVLVEALTPDELVLAWASDAGAGGFSAALLDHATFTCPELSDPEAPLAVQLSAIGTDARGEQAFATAEVVVVPADRSLAAAAEVPSCGGGAGVMSGFLGLGACLRRLRRGVVRP